MADTLNFSDISIALKEAYQGGSTDDLLAKEHPLVGLITRERDFAETQKRVPVKYLNAQGASPVFATAQSNAVAAVATAFLVTPVNVYQVANIQGRLIEQAAMGNGTKFLKEICDQMDGSMQEVGNRIATCAYRADGGSIGTVGSGTSSPITMLYPEQVDTLEVGMVISANDTNDATSMRSGTGTITAINYDTGVVNYSGTITSLAAGDYIFISTFEGASAAGLEGWCPATAPTSTTFFGVDRSVNVNRLGGTRVDCSSFGPEETFARVNARAQRNAVKPDAWFVNPSDLATLEISLASAKMSPIESTEYNFGYEALVAYGKKIIPDSDCPRGVMWGVPFKHFSMFSIGDAPKILNADGNDILRSGTADTYQGRVGARLNFYSDAPGCIVRAALAV